jgi:hypothetical protein
MIRRSSRYDQIPLARNTFCHSFVLRNDTLAVTRFGALTVTRMWCFDRNTEVVRQIAALRSPQNAAHKGSPPP